VEIRNLNVYRGGESAVLAEGCDGLRIDNADIQTDNDGVVLSGCHNVTIANCRIDAVHREYGKPVGGGEAIKVSGDDPSSENIVVQNCFLKNK
jgi:polygalacturonase